ncbi:MAG: peptidylprolyl isomerase [Pyrinomonadaceae bacterium]
MPDRAKNGDTAFVHYTGTLEDGQVFDTSDGSEPLKFQVGASEVIPGFDDGVRGMAIGEKKRIEIESDDAYGPRVDELVQSVDRDSINLGSEPEVGMNLVMHLPDGNQIPVAVTQVIDQQVTLDANHPLAGQKLIFEVELVELESTV